MRGIGVAARVLTCGKIAAETAATTLSFLMEKIAFVSATFGGIDSIKPLPAHSGIDAFCYVDEQAYEPASRETLATWTRVIIPNYPRYDFGPRLRSHYFKQQITGSMKCARTSGWFGRIVRAGFTT